MKLKAQSFQQDAPGTEHITHNVKHKPSNTKLPNSRNLFH